MKLKQSMQWIMIAGSVLSLAACTSAHKRAYDQAAINQANAAYMQREDAESSGIGNEQGYDEEEAAAGHQRDEILSKRIYYFDFDSDVVHNDDRAAILANADYLIAHPHAKVMLEGHTDPRGSREYNIGLGERRANAVAHILTQKGVKRAQIRVVSYGAQKLASPGRTEADYQRDRRVVLVYLQR